MTCTRRGFLKRSALQRRALAEAAAREQEARLDRARRIEELSATFEREAGGTRSCSFWLANDAVLIDTTGTPIDAVVSRVLDLVLSTMNAAR